MSLFRIAEGKIIKHRGYANESRFWYRVGLNVPEIMLAFGHDTSSDTTP